MAATRVFVCRVCDSGADFFHTEEGIVCSGCHSQAVVLDPVVDNLIPFGITRQLEELDRMLAL